MISLPDLDDSDVPDIQTLTLEELDKVPFDKAKWECCIKHCGSVTTVRDYGISPYYFWRKKWMDMRCNFFMCGKHCKRYRKRYGGKISNWWPSIPEHYFKFPFGLSLIKKP